jgi:hypothetical protein
MRGPGVAVPVAGELVEPNEALHAVLGYAFATHTYSWRPPEGAVGDAPKATTVPRWAYRAYDCVPPAPGAALGGTDLFVAGALNAAIDARTIASVLAVEPEVSAALADLPAAGQAAPFWELDRAHLEEPPPDSSPAQPMWRAWTALMGAPGTDVAVTHKTLHHKRPDMFPVLDRLTQAQLPSQTAWTGVHDELTANPHGWTWLEHHFAAAAAQHGGVPLTRLRIHDVLVWLKARGQYASALSEGRTIAAADVAWD